MRDVVLIWRGNNKNFVYWLDILDGWFGELSIDRWKVR